MRFVPSVLLLTSSLLFACSGTNDPDEDRPRTGESGAPFFLPTGEPANTSAPVVAVDASGGIHTVYPAYVAGAAFYAYCASDCRGPDDVRVVRLPTDSTVHNAMLALDAAGHPHVLLSTALDVSYAACTGDCTQAASWTTSKIVSHQGDREVTGEAFAIDAQGRLHFMMHTYVAYLGIGQKAPATHHLSCDASCTEPGNWVDAKVADQIWRSSSLRFDANNRAHLATVALVVDDKQSTSLVGAYLQCSSDCDNPDSWVGQGLANAFQNELDAVAVKPAVSLALTKSGAPRILMMGQDELSQRHIAYWSCDADCVAAPWTAAIVVDDKDIGAGLDLALDAQDRPRFVFTHNYNIQLAACDDSHCEGADAKWNVSSVEAGAQMPPDTIYLYPNCIVSAWFLHSPSIALAANGAPRVGYQARDISGGWNNPTPDKTPDCVAGTDMTWSRMALLPPL